MNCFCWNVSNIIPKRRSVHAMNSRLDPFAYRHRHFLLTIAFAAARIGTTHVIPYRSLELGLTFCVTWLQVRLSLTVGRLLPFHYPLYRQSHFNTFISVEPCVDVYLPLYALSSMYPVSNVGS